MKKNCYTARIGNRFAFSFDAVDRAPANAALPLFQDTGRTEFEEWTDPGVRWYQDAGADRRYAEAAAVPVPAARRKIL